MKSLFLHLACLHLASGLCPEPLQAFDAMGVELSAHMHGALDVACGVRNFTIEFWSPHLVEEYSRRAAIRRIPPNHTSFTPQDLLPQALNAFYKPVEFAALDKSLEEEFKRLSNKHAMDFVEIVSGAYQNTEDYFSWYPGNRFPTTLNEIHMLDRNDSIRAAYDNLPLAAQIELSQAMKRALGIVESPERHRGRVEMAMKALGQSKRSRSVREHSLILHELIRTSEPLLVDTERDMKTAGERITFANCAMNMKEILNGSGIYWDEVLPAVESLFIRYRSLKKRGARKVVEKIIKQYDEHYLELSRDNDDDGTESKERSSSAEILDNSTLLIMIKTIYKLAPIEAYAELALAFRELHHMFEKELHELAQFCANPKPQYKIFPAACGFAIY